MYSNLSLDSTAQFDVKFEINSVYQLYRFIFILFILIQWCPIRNYPPTHTLFKMMFLQLLVITEILDYRPDSFNFKGISRDTVYNWNTNLVHTIFPIL